MPPKTSILIVGGGAVGSLAAYALSRSGQCHITLVCRSNYAAVSHDGLKISSITHGKNITYHPDEVVNTVPSAPSQNPYEYIVLTTKNTPDLTPTAAELISPAITPNHTTIILHQNGINIEKPFEEKYPHNSILSGISLIGASETSPGVIQHDEPDVSLIGPFTPTSTSISSAQKFVALYSHCPGVKCSFDENVPFTRWRKLLYNASYNSSAALLGLDVIRMRMSEFLISDLVKPVMGEVRAVAKASAGVELPAHLDEEMILSDSVEGNFMPSMGQDVRKGNPIEVENIVGEVVREARKCDVQVPVLGTVYTLLRGVQLRILEQKGLWGPGWREGNPYR
ncbi:putative 2-dehydropantoate 2-reductase [Piedraia hortae CBS 480.64]|uniref:2-dehydropantoate 2-reductase n=1 Tax=Piedraia hortae CBS 480.64 TaxID=1314780 RepID=A0A6A7C9P6_9PEZI|nr:putative 2-dehydropantoate 2-reductase [Piedraia hortae CBS 480.64]